MSKETKNIRTHGKILKQLEEEKQKIIIEIEQVHHTNGGEKNLHTLDTLEDGKKKKKRKARRRELIQMLAVVEANIMSNKQILRENQGFFSLVPLPRDLIETKILPYLLVTGRKPSLPKPPPDVPDSILDGIVAHKPYARAEALDWIRRNDVVQGGPLSRMIFLDQQIEDHTTPHFKKPQLWWEMQMRRRINDTETAMMVNSVESNEMKFLKNCAIKYASKKFDFFKFMNFLSDDFPVLENINKMAIRQKRDKEERKVLELEKDRSRDRGDEPNFFSESVAWDVTVARSRVEYKTTVNAVRFMQEIFDLLKNDTTNSSVYQVRCMLDILYDRDKKGYRTHKGDIKIFQEKCSSCEVEARTRDENASQLCRVIGKATVECLKVQFEESEHYWRRVRADLLKVRRINNRGRMNSGDMDRVNLFHFHQLVSPSNKPFFLQVGKQVKNQLFRESIQMSVPSIPDAASLVDDGRFIVLESRPDLFQPFEMGNLEDDERVFASLIDTLLEEKSMIEYGNFKSCQLRHELGKSFEELFYYFFIIIEEIKRKGMVESLPFMFDRLAEEYKHNKSNIDDSFKKSVSFMSPHLISGSNDSDDSADDSADDSYDSECSFYDNEDDSLVFRQLPPVNFEVKRENDELDLPPLPKPTH